MADITTKNHHRAGRGLAMKAAAFGLTAVAIADAGAEPAPAVVATDAERTLFEEVPPDASGLRFVNPIDEDAVFAYLYHSGYACGGVTVGDVNGDRLPDVFLAGGPTQSALFLNRGEMRFQPAPDSRAMGDSFSWSIASAMADVDADGDLDLYVCNYDAPNRLWLNDGNGHFTECGAAAGLAFIGPSLCPYFADFDGDGDLDLFLLTNRLYSSRGYPSERAWEREPDGTPVMKPEYASYFRIVEPPFPTLSDEPFIQEFGHEDRLFRNDGSGPDGNPTFTDVTRGSGIDGVFGHGLSALVWDVNRDGLPDIYVANDYIDDDRWWLNEGPDANGRFRFRDATGEMLPYTTWFSMGSDVSDLDGDGRLDFMVADMAATTHFKAKSTMGEMSGMRLWVLQNGWPRQTMRNCLFLDSGAGRFQESAFLSGLGRSDWTWSVKMADFDLDVDVDVFLTNGIARTFSDSDIVVTDAMRVGRTEWDIYRDAPEMRERNLAFSNDGNAVFSPAGKAWGLDREGMSYGAATADLDLDGDLDLVVANLGENVALYRNSRADGGGRWLRIRLESPKAPGHAIGAVVTATLPDGRRTTRLFQPQTGFLSGNEPVVHFGLGDHAGVEKLEVRWSDGTVQSLDRQPANSEIVIMRASDAAAPAPGGMPEPASMFEEIAAEIGLDFRHREKPFDDYAREFLLPGKLSQFGPGVAVADVDADGRDDLFVGGAGGQAGSLLLQSKDGRFQAVTDPPWSGDAEREDMGALFFDADRDGDLDLYVASGSNEWDENDPRYGDRIYLNEFAADGTARFTNAPANALPGRFDSSSCVVGADFDRDGDVDLFVGSRSVPGRYPVSPESILLRNEGTMPGEVRFSDATLEIGGDALRRPGLVTAAQWTDVDSDGWPDLLIACEWGPVRLLMNRGGRLEEKTESAGLGGRIGWWSGLAAFDVDGDGDLDYAALNVGFNTKYGRPAPDHPVHLYYGDMDENGTPDLVEAKAGDDTDLPIRGRSCSGTAMPFIKEKFGTFREFASANLEEIYTPRKLEESIQLSANTFASGILVNESRPGEPRFEWRELPPDVQLSPGFGAVSLPVPSHGDPGPVLALVQNLDTREPETGLWRGGLGQILRLDSRGTPTVLDHAETGFVVPGDAKGLAVADIDSDGIPDLVATRNNDSVLAFRARGPSSRADSPDSRIIAVSLAGPPGNPSALGARISLLEAASRRSVGTVEVTGGGGYLSQSSARGFLMLPDDRSPDRFVVEVRWPDGGATTHPLSPDAASAKIRISR